MRSISLLGNVHFISSNGVVQQLVNAPPPRSYVQVASSTVRPQVTNVQPPNTISSTANIPRYGPVHSANSRGTQGQGVTTFTTMSTTTTTVFTTAGSRPLTSAGRNVNNDLNPPRDQQYQNL